jgi:hypothetical protein
VGNEVGIEDPEGVAAGSSTVDEEDDDGCATPFPLSLALLVEVVSGRSESVDEGRLVLLVTVNSGWRSVVTGGAG